MAKVNASNSAPAKRGRGRPKLTEAEVQKFRSQVSSVARVLFIQDGYEGVSLRKIAASIPCSTAVLYNHFSGKREILQEIWDDIFAKSFQYCHKATKGHQTAIDKLHAFCTAYVKYWAEHPEQFKMIFLLDRSEKEDSYYVTHSFSYLKYEWITEVIDNGARSGELQLEEGVSTYDVAEALYSLGQGLSYREVFQTDRQGKYSGEIADRALAGLLRGLCKQNSGDGPKR